MIDFTSIPSSTAQPIDETMLLNSEYKVTSTGSIDEKKLYHDINRILLTLETSLEINKDELGEINSKAEEFQFAIDEKAEVLLRIDWLHRLYKTKDAILLVDTKEKAENLNRLISSVQTCPLKKELMAELDKLTQSLPNENTTQSEPSIVQQMMEKAFEEVGDLFINLGKVGREYVIASVLEKFGDNANVDHIKEITISIEHRVLELSKISDPNEMIACLEQLPLQSFTVLNKDSKEEIAARLIELNNWNGLAALDRKIAQLDRAISNERKQVDAQNTIQTKDGKVALSLNIENDIKGFIKIG